MRISLVETSYSAYHLSSLFVLSLSQTLVLIYASINLNLFHRNKKNVL